jgi:hypothetical protein
MVSSTVQTVVLRKYRELAVETGAGRSLESDEVR